LYIGVDWRQGVLREGAVFRFYYPGNIKEMAVVRSKITAQGQISIPVSIRRKLGVGPGSVLEWDEDGANIVVRRAGCFSSEDIHRALFSGRTPKRRSLEELKEGVRRYARKRYARD
jgi:AbrB family looped-hinge helix DNA binding protein